MALDIKRHVVMNPAEGLGTAGIAFSTALTAGIVYSPTRPVRVVRWGVVITVAPTGANPLVLRGDTWAGPIGTGTRVNGSTANIQAVGYNASNSPPFFVDTAGGTLTVPTASFGLLPIGTFVYHNLNPQAAQVGGYYPAPETAFIPPGGVDTQLVIYPGQSFQITQVNTLTAGSGIFFLDMEEQNIAIDFNNNPMIVSGYPSGSGTIPTPSFPFPVLPFNGQS